MFNSSPQVEIIANDQGNRTTPSYVAFTDTERLLDNPAKNQVSINSMIAMNLMSTINPKITISPMITFNPMITIVLNILLQVAINPTNTIFDAKRLIGRKFADATVHEAPSSTPAPCPSSRWAHNLYLFKFPIRICLRYNF